MHKYLAELLGTLILTLAVLLSLAGSFPVPTPVLAGLTLGLLVYSLGHVSGAHLNPAVTIGLWSLGKISTLEALGYVVAQFLGAWLAPLAAHVLNVTPAVLQIGNAPSVGLAEALGALVFTFGIAAVVYGKTPAAMSGAVVGGSLVLGIALASSVSNGVLNPAVAYGIGSFSSMYVLGPVVGALSGMHLLRWLSGRGQE